MKRLAYRQEQIILNNDYLRWLLESLENIFFYGDNKCKNAGLPKPQINDNGYMVKVIFVRPLAKDKRTVEEQLENS